MAPRTSNVDLAQQIGRMAAVLDRVPEDRKEFLTQIDKLDGSITSMSNMISEMRAAFAGMIRRTETLEVDSDRCEKLEHRVDLIEDRQNNRKRTITIIATAMGGVSGSVVVAIWQFVEKSFNLH